MNRFRTGPEQVRDWIELKLMPVLEEELKSPFSTTVQLLAHECKASWEMGKTGTADKWICYCYVLVIRVVITHFSELYKLLLRHFYNTQVNIKI